ncbi:autotransporter outer membrane beta-barrel domain-containing protein, partial [Helicobacter brantae]
MKKAFVSLPLFYLVGGELVLANDCLQSSSNACFQYQYTPLSTPNQWQSYKKLKEGVFGSLENFDGQFVPKEGSNQLSLYIHNAALILSNPKKTKDASIFVDSTHSVNDMLSLSSIYSSVMIDILAEDTARHSNRFRASSRRVINLHFNGNQKTPQGIEDLSQKNIKDKMENSDSFREYENLLAFVGSVANHSGKQASLVFGQGARMLGDLFASFGENSVVFNVDHSMWRGREVKYPNAVVFEGGLQAIDGGENVLAVKEGDMVLKSVGLGDYGVLAKDGGRNTIYIGNGGEDKASQKVLASKIVAISSNENVMTQNHIVFKNFKDSNTLCAQSIKATSSSNLIQTMEQKYNGSIALLDLEVKENIISSGRGVNQKVGNKIVIDGNLSVGASTASSSYGIFSYGGENVIYLYNPYTPNGNDKNGNLETPIIYAGGDAWSSGENIIKLEGKLTLTYSSLKDGVRGAKIVAENGGENYIEVKKGIGTAEYLDAKKKKEIGEGELNNDISHLRVIAKSGGKNTININDTKQNETMLYMGGMIAEGGSNEVALSSKEMGSIKIGLMSSSGGGGYGSNHLTLLNQKYTEIKTIITDKGGENNVLISSNNQDMNEQTIKLGFSYQDKTSVYIKNFSGNTLKSGLGVVLEGQSSKQDLTLEIQGGDQNYWLKIGDGSFYGKIWTTSQTHYDLRKNTIFSGTISSDSSNAKDLKGGNLSLQSNSKFILKNEGNTGFDTLILFSSRPNDDNLLKDTTKLSRTTLDLATNGESFSQFSRGDKGKTLDIETMVINMGEDNFIEHIGSPLVRLYVAGMGEGEADNLRVGRFVGKSEGETWGEKFFLYKTRDSSDKELQEKAITNLGTSLDAQVFLPTGLIGTDFTGKGVTILSVASGGGDLNVTSKKAQTGFTTYWVEIKKEEIDKISQDNGASSANEIQATTLALANQSTSSQTQASLTSSTSPIATSTTTSSSSPSNASKFHRWVLGKTMDASINQDSMRLAGTLLAHNHSAWTMVLNSLNKRMGELRGNPYPQGVWARIFGGEQTSTQGYAQIDSNYIALQAGYDYNFSLSSSWGEALDYVGVALSYGAMFSKSQEFMGNDFLYAPYAYDAFSHSIELGVYNVYIHSCGLYSDSIIKFGFITTDFKGVNAHSSQANISNYHITLGEEVGYRIRLGKNSEWSITPQVELIYGYLSESEAKQEYDGQTLHSILEGVSTFRTRLGSDFSYRLKHKNQIYDFILGVSYEADYANADASYGILGATYLDKVSENALISTDHRMVLDVGVNINLCEDVRFYTNLESSFFGKINTKYEINVGVRYSFGE